MERDHHGGMASVYNSLRRKRPLGPSATIAGAPNQCPMRLCVRCAPKSCARGAGRRQGRAPRGGAVAVREPECEVHAVPRRGGAYPGCIASLGRPWVAAGAACRVRLCVCARCVGLCCAVVLCVLVLCVRCARTVCLLVVVVQFFVSRQSCCGRSSSSPTFPSSSIPWSCRALCRHRAVVALIVVADIA